MYNDYKDLWLSFNGILDNSSKDFQYSLDSNKNPKPRMVMGWNHCHRCSRSFSRFWFYSKEQFDKEVSENIKCPWCDGETKVFHETDEEIMPQSEFGVDI